LLIFAGCEKHPLDYRNKFLGDYTFSVHESGWGFQNGSVDTTFTSGGRVWYGSDKHSVEVTISGLYSFEFEVFEDGTLGQTGSGYGGHIQGVFESTKTIKFSLASGGLGGGWDYDVTGNKK